MSTPRQQARIPRIMQLELNGLKQGEIANTLGVSRMQVWRDRQDPLYIELVERFFVKYCEKLEEFMDEGSQTSQIEALRELGRMYRAGLVKRIESKSANLDIQLRITDNRNLMNEIRDNDPKLFSELKEYILNREDIETT